MVPLTSPSDPFVVRETKLKEMEIVHTLKHKVTQLQTSMAISREHTFVRGKRSH